MDEVLPEDIVTPLEHRKCTRGIMPDGRDCIRYFNHMLPDGVEVILAMDFLDQFYIRIANRRLAADTPEQFKLRSLVLRLYNAYRGRPNTDHGWSEDARDYAETLGMLENIHAHRLRFIDHLSAPLA
jgi:hypothetical protein